MSETTEDFLSHYGVQGMKWGKRKGGSGGASSARKSKPSSDDILGARRAQAARLRNLQEAEGDFYVARTAKGQDKAEKIMRRLEKDFYTNPDAATAARMTKSEKVGAGIVYGMTGAMAIGYAVLATKSMYR